LTVITISRQSGSYGREIAEQLSAKLNIPLITRKTFLSEYISEIATPYELDMLEQSPKIYLTQSRSGIIFKDYIENKLREVTSKSSCVILGMGAQIIFSNSPDVLKIRVIASKKTRLKRFGKKYGLDEAEAERLLYQSDKRHKKYLSVLYGEDWSNPMLYDIILNTDNMPIEQCVELIAFNDDIRKTMRLYSTQVSVSPDENIEKAKKPVFKHPAEEEFANILNMYGIEWEYEPKTFPVRWDAEGNVTMAISPDFFLPRFNTYIEITTMDQKYVTTKNKKVKLLKELYPDININIVYKKDFYSLLERFGFSGVDEINGFNRH